MNKELTSSKCKKEWDNKIQKEGDRKDYENKTNQSKFKCGLYFPLAQRSVKIVSKTS